MVNKKDINPIPNIEEIVEAELHIPIKLQEIIRFNKDVVKAVYNHLAFKAIIQHLESLEYNLTESLIHTTDKDKALVQRGAIYHSRNIREMIKEIQVVAEKK